MSQPLDPFVEVVLAPTSRATCRHGGGYRHAIDKGTLVLKSHYIPAGRNHFEATSKALICISKTRLANLIENAGGFSKIRGVDALSDDARRTAAAIVDAITSGAPIPESDATFLEAPPPKKRAPKRPVEPALEADASETIE